MVTEFGIPVYVYYEGFNFLIIDIYTYFKFNACIHLSYNGTQLGTYQVQLIQFHHQILRISTSHATICITCSTGLGQT